MYYVSEDAVKAHVTQGDVTAAVAEAFIALAKGEASNFPVVRETLGYADAIFGFKSGFDRSGPTLGVKAGGLWPGNRARGIANHQSTIVLFDPETGGPHALVRGTYLTALRTAAASALSIRRLARADAETLGLLGAGGQGWFQAAAALKERAFKRVLIADKDDGAAARLAEQIHDLGVDAASVAARDMAAESDVVITVTPSFEPVIEGDWLRPGTHVASMGADTKGKQELDVSIPARASVFCDEPAQAVSLGECQHAHAAGTLPLERMTPLGAVLAGDHGGRGDADEITLFDSTGMGLQDLAAARIALQKAIDAGAATRLT